MATTYNFSNDFATFVANNVKGGQFGYSVVTLTEPSKMRKTNNPYVGRVKKLALITNALLGCSYERAVERLMPKGSDGETPIYNVSEPRGMHYVVPNTLLESDSIEGRYYLNVMYRKSTKVVTLWLVDDRLATDKEIAEILTFIPMPKPCQKQIDAGVAKEDVVLTIRPMLDNIVLIRQSDDKEWNNTKIPYNIIKTLFEK